MPLQVADPQHQLRNCGGARVDLDAEEVLRRDGVAGELGDILVVPQLDQQIEHLALQLLHARHGDIEEVAGAAGGIEHPGLGKPGMKCLDKGLGLVRLALFDQGGGGPAHPVPVGTQRFHDCGADQPFDIGARGVMGAELGPLLGVERAFEQGAEDRGFNLGPDVFGSLDQYLQLLGIEGQGGALLEQIAVELPERHAERRGELALVHRRPQRGKLVFEMFRVGALVLEELGEAALGDQLAVLGEHREQHPHEEAAGGLGIIAALFEAAGDRGEQIGNVAGDAGGAGGGIEDLGIGPDGAQTVAHTLVAQVLKHDPVARPVGELGVCLSGTGEIGIDLDAIADVGDEQKRRPAMIDGERLGVAFGLTLGLHHRLGPSRRAAPGGATGDAGFGGLAEDVEIVIALIGRRTVRLAALLGFEDEAAALVAVDPAEAGGAVAIVLKDAAFEDVVVRGVVSLRAAWGINA